jgi:hypothetical protein
MRSARWCITNRGLLTQVRSPESVPQPRSEILSSYVRSGCAASSQRGAVRPSCASIKTVTHSATGGAAVEHNAFRGCMKAQYPTSMKHRMAPTSARRNQPRSRLLDKELREMLRGLSNTRDATRPIGMVAPEKYGDLQGGEPGGRRRARLQFSGGRRRCPRYVRRGGDAARDTVRGLLARTRTGNLVAL